MGPGRPDSEVPGGAAAVLSGDELGGEAGGDGRVGPGELPAGEGRVRVRVHDAAVEQREGHAGGPVVLRRRGVRRPGVRRRRARREQERAEVGEGL